MAGNQWSDYMNCALLHKPSNRSSWTYSSRHHRIAVHENYNLNCWLAGLLSWNDQIPSAQCAGHVPGMQHANNFQPARRWSLSWQDRSWPWCFGFVIVSVLRLGMKLQVNTELAFNFLNPWSISLGNWIEYSFYRQITGCDGEMLASNMAVVPLFPHQRNGLMKPCHPVAEVERA